MKECCAVCSADKVRTSAAEIEMGSTEEVNPPDSAAAAAANPPGCPIDD